MINRSRFFNNSGSPAFSITELLVIMATLAILAMVFLPQIPSYRARSALINCANCQKQIGLAFATWANDHSDRFPMQVSVTNGGTMELKRSGMVWPHFQVISNELSTLKIVYCPDDTNRSYGTNFATFTDKNLSYFLNEDLALGDGSGVRSGDRNITNRAQPGTRLVSLTSGSSIGWTKEIHSERGHLGFGDGSVRSFRNDTMQGIIRIPPGQTNVLAVP